MYSTDLEGGGGLRESPRDRMSFLLSLLLPSFRPGDALGTRSARIICAALPIPSLYLSGSHASVGP